MPSNQLDPAPEVVSAARGHAIATWNGFLIQIWREGTPPEAARQVRAAAAQLAARRTGALATVVVVEAGASMPEPQARAEIAAMVTEQSARVVGAALVHEGQGFRAAAIRAVMTGMMAMARNPFPHHVTATVDEARAWLARDGRLPEADVAALPRAIEAVRAAIR